MKTSLNLLMAVVTGFSVALPLKAQSTANLIGVVVTDSHHQHAGKIKELTLDLEAGRVAEVLVDTGGYLTSKPRIVAVPPEVFIVNEATGEARMNADIDAFENAPEFNAAAAPSHLRDVYLRFHIQPYPNTENLELSEKLIGITAKMKNNQPVGQVDSILVDLPNGRISKIVFSSSTAAERGHVTAFSPQGFLLGPAHKILVLNK